MISILECKLTALQERQQCKKVIAWSGDFGMDQYVSWGLPTDQLTPEIIWGRYEEFCKPKSNEVHVQDSTFWQVSGKAIKALMNGIKHGASPSQPSQVPSWNSTDSSQGHFLGFFLRDEDFVSRTISDGSVNLEKFPASRVQQLTKTLESSKATEHAI